MCARGVQVADQHVVVAIAVHVARERDADPQVAAARDVQRRVRHRHGNAGHAQRPAQQHVRAADAGRAHHQVLVAVAVHVAARREAGAERGVGDVRADVRQAGDVAARDAARGSVGDHDHALSRHALVAGGQTEDRVGAAIAVQVPERVGVVGDVGDHGVRHRGLDHERIDDHRVGSAGIVDPDQDPVRRRELEPGGQRLAHGVVGAQAAVAERAAGLRLDAQGVGRFVTRAAAGERELEHELARATRARVEREALLQPGLAVHVPLDQLGAADLDARSVARDLARRDRRELAAAAYTSQREIEEVGGAAASGAVVYANAVRLEPRAQVVGAIGSLEAAVGPRRAVLERGEGLPDVVAVDDRLRRGPNGITSVPRQHDDQAQQQPRQRPATTAAHRGTLPRGVFG